METIDRLSQIKLLGDDQRMAILRRLMDRPATLSQLGQQLGASPAHIRHHLKSLEQAGLVELSATQAVRGFVEKYYRATRQAYLIQVTILPAAVDDLPALVLGSNDPLLQSVLAGLESAPQHPSRVFLPLDSLEGLVRLREGVCGMSTLHLPGENGEYNRSFVRHFFPGEPMVLVRLYRREQGLLLPNGNPQGITGLADLARPGLRFIDREPGSGTRVWLDQALARLGLPRPAAAVQDARSHAQVAAAVAGGLADAGIGLPSSARRYGLSYIPLFEEPYELALSRQSYTDPRCQSLFEAIASRAFQEAIQREDGYLGLQERGQVVFIE